MSTSTNPAAPDERHQAPASARPAPTSSTAADQPTYPPTDTTRPVVEAPLGQREVEQRQREQFGGMKIGAAFFGWLTATGAAVILTALIAAIAAALGLTGTVEMGQVTSDPQIMGLAGVIALLAVVLVAYYCGGYVAGRMARFNGARQGIGVWLWAIVMAIVLTVLTAIAGAQFDVIGRLSGLPRIPIAESTLTASGIVTALLVAAVGLVGAIFGGLAGMRFHRRVDRRTDLTRSA